MKKRKKGLVVARKNFTGFVRLLICLSVILFFDTASLYAYTQEEYRIYKEVMDTPMSIPEEEIHKRLAVEYGKSKEVIKETVTKVMNEIYFKGSKEKEEIKKKIEDIVSTEAEITTLIVSGDFANVGYLETMKTWNEKDVKNKITKKMPEYLTEIFNITEINKIRLTAYYPTTDGGQMKVASLEVEREEFHKDKNAKDYKKFWSRID